MQECLLCGSEKPYETLQGVGTPVIPSTKKPKKSGYSSVLFPSLFGRELGRSRYCREVPEYLRGTGYRRRRSRQKTKNRGPSHKVPDFAAKYRHILQYRRKYRHKNEVPGSGRKVPAVSPLKVDSRVLYSSRMLQQNCSFYPILCSLFIFFPFRSSFVLSPPFENQKLDFKHKNGDKIAGSAGNHRKLPEHVNTAKKVPAKLGSTGNRRKSTGISQYRRIITRKLGSTVNR